MLKWIRYSPLLLKAHHSSSLNNWRLIKGPAFRLISPESRSNKEQNDLPFLSLNLDLAKMLSSLWECEVLTTFVISKVSWVKTWKVTQDFNLLWGNIGKDVFYFPRKYDIFSLCRKWKRMIFIKKRVEIWYFLYICAGVTSMTLTPHGKKTKMPLPQINKPDDGISGITKKDVIHSRKLQHFW